MTRKPNLAKFMLGIAVLALLFIGAMAITHAPLTSAKKIAVSPPAASNNVGSRYAAPLAPAAGEDNILLNFELEGDITDSPAGPPDDWVTVNCDGGTADVKTGVLHDGLGTSIFTGGGSKDPELLASWKHKNGSVPDKDEIINAYAAKYTGSPNGDDILVFGADRFDNSGTAFIGFWFFTSPVFAAADGKFRTGPLASDPLAAHAVGDILIIVEFSNGGAVATAKVLEWVGSGGSESSGTLNNITATAPFGSVFSVSNASPVTIPTTGTCPASWQYTPKGGVPGGAIPTNSFFEGGINLDAFPALAGACFSSFAVETRSSTSVTATLKDFVLGQFNTCPNPDITKAADSPDVCDGTPTVYTYTVSNPIGSQSVDVTLSDDAAGGTPYDPAGSAGGTCIETTGGGTAAGPGSPITIAGGATRTFQCTRTLSVGAHTNTVTMTWNSGSQSKTASATVTVHATPDARITVMTCADGTTFLTASDANNTAGVTFTWTGAGGASTTGTTRTLTGTGAYTVTADNGFCSDSATRTVSLCSDTVDAP